MTQAGQKSVPLRTDNVLHGTPRARGCSVLIFLGAARPTSHFICPCVDPSFSASSGASGVVVLLLVPLIWLSDHQHTSTCKRQHEDGGDFREGGRKQKAGHLGKAHHYAFGVKQPPCSLLYACTQDLMTPRSSGKHLGKSTPLPRSLLTYCMSIANRPQDW